VFLVTAECCTGTQLPWCTTE